MAIQGILTKNIKLGYSTTGTAPITYTNLEGLVSCPALGQAANQVDVTTLADSSYHYIKGLIDYGQMEFGFIYDEYVVPGSGSTSTQNFAVLKGLEDEDRVYWQVEFPDGVKFTFTGQCNVYTSETAIDDAIKFTLNIAIDSDITVTYPTSAE